MASTPVKPSTAPSDAKHHLCQESLPSNTRSTGTPELDMACKWNIRPMSTGRSRGMSSAGTPEVLVMPPQTPRQVSARRDANPLWNDSNSITSLPLRLSTPTPLGEEAQVQPRGKVIATRKLVLSSPAPVEEAERTEKLVARVLDEGMLLGLSAAHEAGMSQVGSRTTDSCSSRSSKTSLGSVVADSVSSLDSKTSFGSVEDREGVKILYFPPRNDEEVKQWEAQMRNDAPQMDGSKEGNNMAERRTQSSNEIEIEEEVVANAASNGDLTESDSFPNTPLGKGGVKEEPPAPRRHALLRLWRGCNTSLPCVLAGRTHLALRAFSPRATTAGARCL